MREAGYRITLAVPSATSASAQLAKRGIEIHCLETEKGPCGRMTGRRFVRSAVAHLDGLRADGVHAVGPVALEAAARAGRRAPVRLVYDAPLEAGRARSDVLTEWRWLGRVDLVLTSWPGSGRRFELRAPAIPVRTVRTRFPKVALLPSMALPRRLGLGPEHSLILVPWSAHSNLGLRSFAAALRRLPACVHAALGGYGTGRHRAALWREHARAAGLDNRVHVAWFTSREEMVTWARGAQLGCVLKVPPPRSDPAEAEVPILHCLSAGLPVLVPEASAYRDLSIGRDAVRRVDMADRWALRGAIASLLGDTETRKQLALAARRAADRNCWEREADELLAAYSRHVGPPRVDRGVPRRRRWANLKLVARGGG